jgi:hypothetical protein
MGLRTHSGSPTNLRSKRLELIVFHTRTVFHPTGSVLTQSCAGYRRNWGIEIGFNYRCEQQVRAISKTRPSKRRSGKFDKTVMTGVEVALRITLDLLP